MSKARPQIVNMNGGEVDGEFLARTDFEGYANRAEILENAFPRVLGGIEKAPGTRHLFSVPTSGSVVYERFRYSVDQTFVIMLEESKIRIIQGDGLIGVSSGSRNEGVWAEVTPPPPPPPPPPQPTPPPGGSFPEYPGFESPGNSYDPYDPYNGFYQTP